MLNFFKKDSKNLIDFKKWEEYIQHPDWYLKFIRDYKRLSRKIKNDPELKEKLKHQIYDFFEEQMAQNKVVLGKSGPNWDEDRKLIDTVVIHHTSNPSGITWHRLSAMHVMRLYAPHYIRPPKEEKSIKGQPIWSGHFKDGQQVFYGYHWLVREDGSVERFLADNEVGWHCGNWEVNCRSIAICLDGNYNEKNPPQAALNAVKKIITEHYSNIQSDRIFGHREINPKTECPGNTFINGWKSSLV